MPETTDIVAYNEFRSQLAELRDFNAKAVFDYESKKGNAEARSHIHKLRRTKSAVDTCRKKEKQESLEYGRKVDSEAKVIIAELEDMIEVHAKPIKEIEQRERVRIESILDRIEEIRAATIDIEHFTAKELQERINFVGSVDITEEAFQEYTEQAIGARVTVLDRLTKNLEARKKYEAEQEELQRLRREAEERERKDREEREAREKKEREERIAREAAEHAKREAEERQRREQEEAKRREEQLKREKEEAIKAQQEAEERGQRAKLEAEQEAKRKAEEQALRESEERKRREADAKHKKLINEAAASALHAAIDSPSFTPARAKRIISLISEGKVPNVSIDY